jgi:hypothetical protein
LPASVGIGPGWIKQDDAVAPDTSLDRTRLTALSGGSPPTGREDFNVCVRDVTLSRPQAKRSRLLRVDAQRRSCPGEVLPPGFTRAMEP